jgi:hypothetical protein
VSDPAGTGRRRAPVSAAAKAPASPPGAATGGQAPLPSSSAVRPPGTDAAAIEARRRRAVEVTAARRGPRRARLVVKHIDPWTVMKMSFIVSLVILVVVVVASGIIYAVLGKMGVWDQINDLVNEVSPTTTSPALHNPLSGSRVVGITALVGGVNVVLLTALATLGAAVYNLVSDLVGGIEVTLTDP